MKNWLGHHYKRKREREREEGEGRFIFKIEGEEGEGRYRAECVIQFIHFIFHCLVLFNLSHKMYILNKKKQIQVQIAYFCFAEFP